MNNDITKVEIETGAKQKTEPENLFDPAHLRLKQNFADLAGVRKVLTTVPAKKPNRQEFIRTHPDDSYRLETAVLESQEDRETYLVDPALWHELPGEITPKVLYTTINRQGILRLWPIRLPGEDGRHDAWNRSALEAAEMAKEMWVRVAANMGAGFYDVFEATGDIPDPEWPDIEFPKILEIAFRDKFISDLNHPVIRRLRGGIMKTLNEIYKEVWLVDFEFSAPSGEVPKVVCMVALELFSGKKIRKWKDELMKMSSAPFSLGEESLYIAYYSSAEFGCHLALNWPLPTNVLDLFTEFRNITNGKRLMSGAGLLGALAWFGLDSIEAAEKTSMRDLVLRGGPWTDEEKSAVLDYCESDVRALEKLLPEMLPHLDLSRAPLRGDAMKAAAHIEFNGIPIDIQALTLIRTHWDDIQQRLIRSIDADYGVYDGQSFRVARFAEWLTEKDIPWPRLPTGRLSLADDTFKHMALAYPEVTPLRELRVALSQMRLSQLAVGSDGRNRCMLSAFRSRTGRFQPSNSKFIFGPAVWLRSLIRPESGFGLAYIDWGQQEFGIAAALSGDEAMKKAYMSGDPYLAFAKQAGAVPPDATKESHAAEREQYKACVLAVQYGMGVDSLAEKIGQPRCQARVLLDKHKRTYTDFWKWSDAAVDHAMLHGKLWTTMGWNIHIDDNPNPRFLRNFLMQGNGADMLRLACCLLVTQGIRICAPVHDAILIEAPLYELDDTVEKARALMESASTALLKGFQLRTDVEVIRYPDRYKDPRGVKMWDTVQGILQALQNDHPEDSQPGRK